MENETIRSTEGLLESVHQGSVIFNERILAPLRNNYLYKESKECFAYNSAHLINNAALQKRYAAFRSEKREKGYSEQELEESFGFLLLEDVIRARKVGETGLLVGQAKCTTLGDSLKGVYISKYSDCLDLKRWYDGKTGYILLFKLTKGRVKEVTHNYTQNFTPPTPGFDCHVSDHLGAVSSTTSSFFAYERTQYYLYELRDGSSKIEPCPRHVCPFAIVAFSYGKMSTSSELEQKSHEKTVLHYQPWIGQFKIESTVYDVGLQSTSGAWLPAKLPKTVQIDHAIGVSELKRTLPREIFETCIVGEVCIGGRCFNVYDVVSSKAKNDLAKIAQELKEKDMALVIPLEDSGFLILLHSSHLFSYEDAKSGKAAALQGMFIFPDSRTVPRDAKTELPNTKVSTEIMQVIPALNYAEAEMEKCPRNQQRASQILEKHLENYGTLFHTGPLDVPAREASMFPDQYDVPGGFTLISPKWSQETGTRLKSYFDEPCGFTIPVGRALELLTTGRQQRGEDHDDDVYYCISSPEEVPQTEAPTERVTKQTVASSDAPDRTVEKVEKQKHEHKCLSSEQSQPALQGGLGNLGTAVVTVPDNVLEYPTSTVSPKLGDVPTENCVSIDTDVKKTSQGSTKGGADGACADLSTKETPIQTRSEPLITSTEEGDTSVGEAIEDNTRPDKRITYPKKKANQRPYSRRKGRKSKIHWKTLQVKKEVKKKLSVQPSSLPLVLPVSSTNVPTKDQIQTETLHADDLSRRPYSTRRGRSERQNFSETREEQDPFLSVSTESIHDESIKKEMSLSKRDWRSLPRRKRLWNLDATLKRSLRSDDVKNEKETVVNTQDDATKQRLISTSKRKMEGFSLRERYGLKTIITNCGRVFVPHGSEVNAESAKKRQNEMNVNTNAKMISPLESKSRELEETKEVVPSIAKEELPSNDQVVNENEDSSDSPSKEMPSALLSALNIFRKLHPNNPSDMHKGQDSLPERSMNDTANETKDSQQTNKDFVHADATSIPPKVSDQSMESDTKVSSPEKIKKKAKHAVYSAISISKLKTVLRRGKRTKSPSSGDSAVDNLQPESKKGKISSNLDDELVKNKLKDKGTEPTNVEAQHIPMKSMELTKQPIFWRGLIPKTSKENGSLNFDTSTPFEMAKHADQQLISSLIGDRVGKRRISVDGKAGAESLSIGSSLPSDALSLLADLALGASCSKTLMNFEDKPGQEALDGVKASGSPESVLHALLRCPSGKFKLPPRSPFPESLLATGELILEISKEHSYSQSTSPLSGFSGPSPQISFPSGHVESPLSLKTGFNLNLPKDAVARCHQEEGGKTVWKPLISSNKPMPLTSKTKARRSRILRNRCITIKEGTIQVVRIFKEAYDFKFDSKFTNDGLDKTVTRALHGKWNFNIEDTYEDVHLIFHMWIGLFYSKATSRLFHLENSMPLSKGKDIEKVHLDINAIQNAVSLLNVEFSSKEDSSKPMHLPSEVLDLSVKNDEPVDPCSVSNQSNKKDTVSHPGGILTNKHGTAPQHSPTWTSLSASPNVKRLMNYRSAVDIPQENSVPDGDDDTDDENGISTDCSYSQHLEKNSAYNQLCEKASNMRIGIRILLPKVRKVINDEASTKVTTSESKKIEVFHRVLKPAAFLKPGHPILGRRSFNLSLNNKTEHGAHAALKKNDVSDSAESKEIFEAHGNKDGCPEDVVDGNGDKTLECKTGDAASVLVQKESVCATEKEVEVSDEDSQDGCLTIMEDGNVEENMISEMSNKDQISAAEHEDNANAKDDPKPSLDVTDRTYMVDDLRDASSHETSFKEHNETSNAKEELKLSLDDSNLVDRADELGGISSDEGRVEEHNKTSTAKEHLKPVPDLEDDANMVSDLRDTSHETNVEEHNKTSKAKEELIPLLDDSNLADRVAELCDISSDETSVQDHETYNSKENLKPVRDLKDPTNMVDELSGPSSDENKIDECNEISNAKAELDLKDLSNMVDASSLVIDTLEEVSEENEINSSLDSSDDKHDTSTEMEEYADGFVLCLEDDINSVEKDLSDEDFENNHEDHGIEMQKSESQSQAPEETNIKYDPFEELSNDSCSDEIQRTSFQEEQTSVPNNDTFEGMQDERSLVVQKEALMCQDESKPTVKLIKLDISHSEKGDKDLVQQDAADKGEENTLAVKKDTQRRCLSSKTGVSFPCSMTDCHNDSVAPQDLSVDKPLEVEVNSLCSTPTQDEIPCYPEVNKEFRKENLNRNLYYPDNTVDMLPPESPVRYHTHVSTVEPLSDFTGHYEETHVELRWKKSKNPGTVDFKDKSALTTDHLPNEDCFQLRHKLCPNSQEKENKNRNFTESEPQNDAEQFYADGDIDDFHGYYHEYDEGVLWPDYQTEEPAVHPLYPCEYDTGDDDSPICSKYITSEWEFSYKHEKRAKKAMDKYCRDEKNYKSDPLSFKYPGTVICSPKYNPKKKSRKSKYTGVFHQNPEWDEDSSSSIPIDYSIQKTSCFEMYHSKPSRAVTVSSPPTSSKQQFDWRRYFRREATCSQQLDECERDTKFDIPPSSIVTVLDRKGNRLTFSNSPTMKPSFDGKSLNKEFEDSFNRWQDQRSKADGTRSTVDLEYLIFSEKLNRVLKENKSRVSTLSHGRPNPEQATCPMTVRFSNLSEVESSSEPSKAQPAVTDFKIKVDLSDRKVTRETMKTPKPHFQRLFCEKGNEVEFSGISEITEQCAVACKSMMNDVCSGKTLPRPTKAIKRKYGRENVGQHSGFSRRIKKDILVSPHDNLKSIVKEASKIKYRFYILVTSTDTFFQETKNLLEIEGHTPVEPDDFDLNGDDQSPLLIILRNEDIAEHICEVPYLLELKKSPSVLFAGIDRPNDVVNLTHQELFAKGGFIVCDEPALDTLTLDDMKKVVGILEELDKQGKWKWFLHYRDSRRLRESARSSPEACKKQKFIDCCQKAGIVEILPYHDCDVISRDRPNYFFCLTRLQIQNASVRFPVFITDTSNEAFGTNGILTMNIYTFSRILSNDTCSVS